MEQNKKSERAIELEQKGFLPENDDYNEVSRASQEIVENNPTRYIIQECLPACEELWNKNIYTFMVSDHLNEGECWIEIEEKSLSEENKQIYKNLSGEGITKFSYHKGCINFGVNCVGKEGQQKLLELAQKFKMQDVPHNEAYITEDEFLLNYCGCYQECENPNYYEMELPWEVETKSLEEQLDYFNKYDKWQGSPESQKTIKKLDLTKKEKPTDVYAQDHGMIVEGDRIYLSPFHYQKHQNYIDYVNANSNQSESGSRRARK